MTKPFVIPKSLVWEAFQRVKDNGGSAGVDDESIAEFERNIGDNLYKLWNRMGSGSYFPPPVKAVPIPKKSLLVERQLPRQRADIIKVRKCWQLEKVGNVATCQKLSNNRRCCRPRQRTHLFQAIVCDEGCAAGQNPIRRCTC